ncbi:MAG: hypothetical protein D6705_10520 [Deltaproteobacteria bacterium]|nr:MAG: hypothetical protein D6705_10520 [Deltaproteobacteria bacterium]
MRITPLSFSLLFSTLLVAGCEGSGSDESSSTGGTASGATATDGTATDSGATAGSTTDTGYATTAATGNATTGDTGGAGGGFCAPSCTTPADCVTGMPTAATDEDNYACEQGACRYLGCHDDTECPDGGGFVTFVCAQPSADQVPVCSVACTAPADCVLSPMDSADNYECIDGGCFNKPCTETGTCQEGFVCAPDLWLGDEDATPGCTYPCETVDDCGMLAGVGQPLACEGGACVYKTCGTDADCPDPSGTTCTQP